MQLVQVRLQSGSVARATPEGTQPHDSTACLQLIIPTDAAHETIAELGDLGLMQFKDLNADQEPFARTYASQARSQGLLPNKPRAGTQSEHCLRKRRQRLQVRRCNEMSRRLRFFHEQVTGAEIPMAGATTDIGADLDELEVRLDRRVHGLTAMAT